MKKLIYYVLILLACQAATFAGITLLDLSQGFEPRYLENAFLSFIMGGLFLVIVRLADNDR